MGSDEVIAKQKKELAKQRKELLEKDDFISYLVKSNNDEFVWFFGSRAAWSSTIFVAGEPEEWEDELQGYGVSQWFEELTNAIAWQILSKNGWDYTFEVAVSSNFNMATWLTLHVTKLTWTTWSENYDKTTE